MNKKNAHISKPVVVLVGPTAVGKTSLSLTIGERFSCEIISLDSMQVYRHMDIGTAKASLEERSRIPHHLIDIVNPYESYDAGRFVEDALQAVDEIHVRGNIPLLTGGTGLYLRAFLEGLFEQGSSFPQLRQNLRRRLTKEGSSKLHDELALIDSNSASKIHKNDTHRLLRALEIYYGTGKSWSEHVARQSQQDKVITFDKILLLGLTCERELLYNRINKRTQVMIDAGLKEEVEKLLSMGFDRRLKSMQSIGYRHMVEHLLDGVALEDTVKTLARDTRRYAKRQYTWFRKMDIAWCNVDEADIVLQKIGDFLI